MYVRKSMNHMSGDFFAWFAAVRAVHTPKNRKLGEMQREGYSTAGVGGRGIGSSRACGTEGFIWYSRNNTVAEGSDTA